MHMILKDKSVICVMSRYAKGCYSRPKQHEEPNKAQHLKKRQRERERDHSKISLVDGNICFNIAPIKKKDSNQKL